MNGDRHQWNLGDILHVIQILALAFTLGGIYATFKSVNATTEIHTQQLNRIEHYLSSKDANYWTERRKDE